MQDNQNINNQPDEEKEIDLLELAVKLWNQRKRLIICSVCGAVIGLIVAISIPREYDTQVKLAPEDTGSKGGGSIGALASMAGFSIGGNSGPDALYPQLYPDVVSSVPFTTALFDVEVRTKDDNKTYTVREYIEDETSAPWWSTVIGLPFKLLGMLRGSDNEDAEGKSVDNFQLSPKEALLVEALNRRVTASVDQKTSVVTIGVKMQDPLVSAILADTVVKRLQDYITAYRTNKARQDLKYAETLNEEAKQAYYVAQQRYAEYLDRNQSLAFQSAQITRDRLENESTLAFNLYNQTAQQVQAAKAKVQETTPVYAIVTPATVPVKASSPRKLMILIGFTFLAFVGCAAWILFGQPLIEEYKDKAKMQG